MENQPTTEQTETERHEVLNKLLETMPVDEAVQLSCKILACLIVSHGIEPESERGDRFFDALRAHLAARVEALDSVPPRIH